jgi:hypothetical protein
MIDNPSRCVVSLIIAARASFEAMGRTDQYAVILKLLKARTPASRETQLRRAIAGLRE